MEMDETAKACVTVQNRMRRPRRRKGAEPHVGDFSDRNPLNPTERVPVGLVSPLDWYVCRIFASLGVAIQSSWADLNALACGDSASLA